MKQWNKYLVPLSSRRADTERVLAGYLSTFEENSIIFANALMQFLILILIY